MSTLTAMYSVSLRQGLPVRRTIMLVLIQLAPAVIYVFATASRTPTAAFQGAIEIGVSIYFGLVLPVVAIVIASGSLGDERRDLTLSFITLRPVSRIGIASAKLLSAVSAAFAINAVGALALGITHGIRFDRGVDMVVALLAGALVSTVAYVSVFLPIGFVTDRAVIIGLGYLLVAENGAIFALSGLALLSPWRLGVTVLADLLDGSRIFLDDAIGTLSAGRAITAMVVYVVGGVALTSYLLSRRDLA